MQNPDLNIFSITHYARLLSLPAPTQQRQRRNHDGKHCCAKERRGERERKRFNLPLPRALLARLLMTGGY